MSDVGGILASISVLVALMVASAGCGGPTCGVMGNDVDGATIADPGVLAGSDAGPGTDAGRDAGDATTMEASADSEAGSAFADATGDAHMVADVATSDGDSAADTAADSGCPMTSVADVPSQASLDFVLTNKSSADRYIVTSGINCDPFAVDQLPLSTTPWVDVCEGPAPYISVTFTRLAAGASLTISWDGRKASTYQTNVDCSSTMGPACLATTSASLVPAAAGAHTAVFGVADAALGSPMCSGMSCSTGTIAPAGMAQTCDPMAAGVAAATVSQPFTLPASGRAMVAVAIP